MGLKVVRYDESMRAGWNDVVATARNSLFLHEREFIEYHGDRFHEISLVVFDDDRPVAVFPAARASGEWELASHPGLTFGGLIVRRELRTPVAISALDAVLAEYRSMGIGSVLIKLLPAQFETYPSAEIGYELWRRGFRTVRKELSSILPLLDDAPYSASRMGMIKKAMKSGVRIVTPSVSDFHRVLKDVLDMQHGVAPVHSSGELELLLGRFPGNIELFGAEQDGELLAVAAVFKYRHVWHTQYLANTPEGRGMGALDLVIDTVIKRAAASGCAYVSFGTSTLSQGRELNEGLLWQKEGFGARSLVHEIVGGTP